MNFFRHQRPFSAFGPAGGRHYTDGVAPFGDTARMVDTAATPAVDASLFSGYLRQSARYAADPAAFLADLRDEARAEGARLMDQAGARQIAPGGDAQRAYELSRKGMAWDTTSAELLLYNIEGRCDWLLAELARDGALPADFWLSAFELGRDYVLAVSRPYARRAKAGAGALAGAESAQAATYGTEEEKLARWGEMSKAVSEYLIRARSHSFDHACREVAREKAEAGVKGWSYATLKRRARSPEARNR